MTDKVMIGRELLEDLLEFLLLHSNRWDGIKGKHPQEIVEKARAALDAPQQEAVAWATVADHGPHKYLVTASEKVRDAWIYDGREVTPLACPAPSVPEWPVLDKPAKVGCGRFHAGVSSRLVVEAAQRHYEYEVTTEKEAERIARSTEAIDALINSAAPKAPTTDDRKDAERWRTYTRMLFDPHGDWPDSFSGAQSLEELESAVDTMAAQKGEKE